VLREFESRLADVLGTRLAAPLAGAVDVTPGGPASRIVVSVRNATPMDDDLLSIRPERVPGAADPRRVVRLLCEVELAMHIPAGGTHDDQMENIDQTVYLLGDTSFRDGSVLQPGDNSDPGFLISRMRFTRAAVPASVTVEAEGLFWPVGQAGQSGVEIVEARIRAAFQPLHLNPPNPRLVAGGPGVDLLIEFGAVGTMTVTEGGGVANAPYGSLVVTVVDAGGRPGAGVLGGGTPGTGASRVVPVNSGAAAFTYTPPAVPAIDHLVVTVENNEGGRGIEIGRFPLTVRSA
jgi:hypothetical protein